MWLRANLVYFGSILIYFFSFIAVDKKKKKPEGGDECQEYHLDHIIHTLVNSMGFWTDLVMCEFHFLFRCYRKR